MNKPDACKELLKLKREAYCICKEPSLRDDLLSEAIVIFLESKIEFTSYEHCKGFVITTMVNLFKQHKNKFNKTYVHETDKQLIIKTKEHHSVFQYQNDHFLCPPTTYEPVEPSSVELTEGRREYVNDHLITVAMDQLHWYNRELLNLYAQGNSYRAISKMTGINHVEIYNSIQAGRKQIFQYLNING
jgi:DNA-directed RNA polymerase specialized sigma24 family protein